MAGDSAARPHELLRLKIKDVMFKLTPDKKQYAEVLVNGKTGNRSLPLINSIPYIKDWINQHPQGANQSSILLCGFGKSLGRTIRIASIGKIYENYKHHFFLKLLLSWYWNSLTFYFVMFSNWRSICLPNKNQDEGIISNVNEKLSFLAGMCPSRTIGAAVATWTVFPGLASAFWYSLS